MRKLPWLDRSVQKLAVGAGAPVRWLELKDLPVLRWEAVVNLVALSVRLLALLQVEAPRRADRLARLAPIAGDVPPFALYRIWMTVGLMLRGALPAGR